jgi:hypothetical protein
VLARLRVFEALREPIVNQVDRVHFLARSNQDIIGLDVPVNETPRMQVLKSGDALDGDQGARFHRKMPFTKYVQRLKGWPENIHYHHVEIPLLPKIMDFREALYKSHHLYFTTYTRPLEFYRSSIRTRAGET